jgi:hypothetical protein
MTRSRNRLARFIGTGLVLLVLAGGAYAFTAANTVPNNKAGAGSGTVSGYTVSAIHYQQNATDPNIIDQVTFTLDSAPVAGSVIKLQLDATPGTTWYTCTFTGTDVTCDTTSPAILVRDIDTFTVVATD